MISTTWPTDRAAKGKTIIMLNIMAVIVALFSYSIIKLVSWIIA
jgi:preprotein translocase subunit SecE